MRTGGLFVVVLLVWLAVGLWTFAMTKNKSAAAIQAALFVVSYPAAMILLFQFKPVPPVIVTPMIMMGVPWLMMGVTLQKLLAEPSAAKPGELLGFPLNFWGWGLAISIVVGVLF